MEKKRLISLTTILLSMGLCLATTIFAETKEIHTNDAVNAYYEQGMRDSDNHEYQKAIIEFEKALQIDPKRAEIYHQLGLAYIRLRQFEQAVTYLQKGIEVNVDYAGNYIALGSAYYNLEQPQKVKENLEKARELLQSQGDYQGVMNVQHLIDVLEKKSY